VNLNWTSPNREVGSLTGIELQDR